MDDDRIELKRLISEARYLDDDCLERLTTELIRRGYARKLPGLGVAITALGFLAESVRAVARQGSATRPDGTIVMMQRVSLFITSERWAYIVSAAQRLKSHE